MSDEGTKNDPADVTSGYKEGLQGIGPNILDSPGVVEGMTQGQQDAAFAHKQAEANVSAAEDAKKD